jgi:hypothetical protein
LLLISTLSAPSTVSASPKALRYGTQKAAGYPSALPDIECRKRVIAGKVASFDGLEGSFACLPAGYGLGLEGLVAAIAVVPMSDCGAGRVEMRGARAPPSNFA